MPDNKFNWNIPTGLNPTCFTTVEFNIKNSYSYSSMDSWSVEECDYNHLLLNFRTMSSEAGKIVACYSDYVQIGTLELDQNIEPAVFYSIRIEYPKEIMIPFIKYKKVILKSQSGPSYPVFAYNSHTHLNLWSPEYNRYEPTVKNSIVKNSGIISDGLKKYVSSEYITPMISDIYDFR